MEADGLLDAYSKKEGASLRREMRKIQRNLGGVRKMDKLPGALVIIDVKREKIAVREANKMGIPVVCLLDTDCDPDPVDIPIPGNDDAMQAIEIVIREMCKAVEEGIRGRAEPSEEKPGEEGASRRRSKRPTTARAEGVATAEAPAEGDGQSAEAPAPRTPEPAQTSDADNQ